MFMSLCTPAEVDHAFKYHAPTKEQIAKYEKLRSTAREFAKVIWYECQLTTTEGQLALQKLQEALMWANAAIAINQTPRSGNEFEIIAEFMNGMKV